MSRKERATLRRLYPNTPTHAIARVMGRSLASVYNGAWKLGLHKSAKYMASPDAYRIRRGEHIGKATQFKKGQVPFNKGLKRPPGWSPGRMAETQFKKGERVGIAARNWRPIGTILADTEGYLRIKVREGAKGEPYGFGNVGIWPMVQRHVWEQHRGPIPAGHKIAFKDGNRANTDIDNLECISSGELMLRNSVHNLPKELAEVIQLSGALKRKLRRYEKQAGGSTQPSL